MPQDGRENSLARIGIDLDGVLFDFADNLRGYLVKEHGWHRRDCLDPTRWEFYEDWGLTEKGFKILCDQAAERGHLFREGRVTDRVQVLHDLRTGGHTIHVVTDRFFGPFGGGDSKESTAKWLKRHSIPYDTLTFTRDKTVVRLDYLIDDKPANCVAVSEVGCKAYLRTQPWNETYNYPNRVSGLAEFAERVAANEQ